MSAGRRELGIGVVSMGWMGRLHAASYRRLPHHFPALGVRPRLVIAADTVLERAQEAVDAFGFEAATEDWREVIGHPEVEAVSITAPNFLHREMALAAAEAGKHFWIEKPVGRTPAETADVEAAARAAGVRTAVGLNYRAAPAVQHARRLVREGELGEVTNVRGWFLNDYARNPKGALSWRFVGDLGGLGVLGDLMSHAVDLVQHVVGPIAEVSARTETFIRARPRPALDSDHFAIVEDGELAPVENEDWAAALVGFANGAQGTMEASRVITGPHCRLGFDVHGTRGALSWDFMRMNELDLHLPGLASGDVGYTTVLAGPGHGHFSAFQPGPGIAMGYDDLKVIEARGFCLSVLDGEQREPGVREALAMARVIDAMQRSSGSGRWEPVGPVTGAADPAPASASTAPEATAPGAGRDG